MRIMSDREAVVMLTETARQQADIITLQSGVIDSLFLLLAQHISSQEIESLPVMGDIERAAKMRTEMEGI